MIDRGIIEDNTGYYLTQKEIDSLTPEERKARQKEMEFSREYIQRLEEEY